MARFHGRLRQIDLPKSRHPLSAKERNVPSLPPEITFQTHRRSHMPKRLVTIITLVSLLTLFPSAFARVGLSNPTLTSASDKSRISSCPTCEALSQKNDPLNRLDNLS